MSDDWLMMDSKLSSTAYKVEVSFSPQLQCTIKHTHYMRPQKKKKRERNFPLKKKPSSTLENPKRINQLNAVQQFAKATG